MSEKQTLLRVENLSRYFGKKNSVKAVDGVSFEIKKGEVFGLVGESGSGKTTTGRAIIGLYPITDGRVWFQERLIASAYQEDRAEVAKNKDLAKGIQMIFQDPASSLNPRMTIGESVAEGLVIRGELTGKEIRERVEETLLLVGLRAEYFSRYPHEFSGGQRQRVGIARALIVKPDLIIADEPVSALDVSVQAQVINLLKELCNKLSLTVLFVAHDLSVVKYLSDRIAVMRNGKILEQASSDELFAYPLHPYTKALLDAIPLPDPNKEKNRQKRIFIMPDEGIERSLQQVAKEHYVYCSKAEKTDYQKENCAYETEAELPQNAACLLSGICDAGDFRELRAAAVSDLQKQLRHTAGKNRQKGL